MITNSKDCSTINDLIKVTIDSTDGYRKAAEAADNHSFRTIFLERATERDAIVDKFQEFVRSLGETPEDDGSLSAGANRMFLKLRDMITGRDDTAVVAEVERGEDYIKERFEMARADADLSSQARLMIEQAYTVIKAGHDQMRDLKHGMTS